MNLTLGAFTLRVVIALALAAAFFLLWKVLEVVVLAFGGIIMAILLRTFSESLARHTGMRESWALFIVILLLILLLGLLIWLMQTRVATEMHQLTQTLPASWSQLRQVINRYPAGSALTNGLQLLVERSGANFGQLAGSTFSALSSLVLMPFLGVFLAATPNLYRNGLISLVPPRGRPAVADALDATTHALRHWLLGVLASMVCIGIVTWGGLSVLGIPLALALGILAGLLEFISFLGPILSALPAILVAFTVGPVSALEVLVLYVVVQHLESYLLVPVLQKRVGALPPALTILAVVMFGLIFGLLGVIFATPLIVATRVLVQKLYVDHLTPSAS